MGTSDPGDLGPRRSAARAPAASILAVIILTLVAYWPVQRNGFVSFDDAEYITRNTVVARGLTAQGVILAFTKSYAANWHPLTWLSHMLDVELFGLEPRSHHLVGLAIHLSTALVLLLVLRQMTGRAGPSLFVAGLFALHPLHVESVASAAERKDLLSGFFWAVTMAAYLRYARRPGVLRYLPVLLCFLLGLMSKPMVVTLPIVLLLLDYWPLRRLHVSIARRRRLPALALEKLPLFAMSMLSVLITIKAQSTSGAVRSLESFPPAARAANAILSYARYVGKAMWPSALAVFYPLEAHRLGEPGVLLATGFLTAGSLLAVALRRSAPWLLTGWLWYLVTLLPVIGLIQVGDQAMADRYTYLPLLGIFVAFAWSFPVAAARRPLAQGVLAAMAAGTLLLLCGLARRQVAVWRSDETLFRHAINVTKDNWKAMQSLGMAREAAGDRAGALRLYRESIRLQPGSSRGHYHYALALDDDGRAAEAIEELRAAVGAKPSDPVYRITLAVLLSRQGRDAEAEAHLRELIKRRPEVAEGYNNLASLLARRGEVDEAARLLRRALEISPAYAEARLNLEALTGKQPEGGGSMRPLPGVPETHRRLFGVPGDR